MGILEGHGAFVLQKRARTFKVKTYYGQQSWLLMAKTALRHYMQSKVKSKVELNLEVNSFSDAGTKEIKVSSVMFLDRRLTFV